MQLQKTIRVDLTVNTKSNSIYSLNIWQAYANQTELIIILTIFFVYYNIASLESLCCLTMKNGSAPLPP